MRSRPTASTWCGRRASRRRRRSRGRPGGSMPAPTWSCSCTCSRRASRSGCSRASRSGSPTSPPTVPRMTLRIGDLPIDIAPGATFTMRDQLVTLPVAVDVLALFPHLHYLGRTVRVRARPARAAAQRALLAIDDWDPAGRTSTCWRRRCACRRAPTLAMELGYDNCGGQPAQSRTSRRCACAPASAPSTRWATSTFELRLRARARQGAAAGGEVSARDRARCRGARLLQPRQHARRAAARSARRSQPFRRAVDAGAVALAGAGEPRARAVRQPATSTARSAPTGRRLAIDPASARVQADARSSAGEEEPTLGVTSAVARWRSRPPACCRGQRAPVEERGDRPSSRSCVVAARPLVCDVGVTIVDAAVPHQRAVGGIAPPPA